jgi:hypothetical protein
MSDYFMFILSAHFCTGSVWLPDGHGYTPIRLTWGNLSGDFIDAKGLYVSRLIGQTGYELDVITVVCGTVFSRF